MSYTLKLFSERYAVCQLSPAAAIPDWAQSSTFVSITRTQNELSIVCEQASIPADTKHSTNWCCFEVEGPFEFSVIGVVAGISSLLAEAKISVLVVCTYDTDYLLIREDDLEHAIAALNHAGHRIQPV